MKESGTKQERISIQYFDGTNSTVQSAISLKSELSHTENCRAPIIGVLEKREGQSVIGVDINGETFVATGNYGLVYFEDGGTVSQGVIRVSSVDGVYANIYYLNQSDEWVVIDNDMALNLSLANCDFANVDGNLIIVNGSDLNRMITGPIAVSDTLGVSTSMETSTSAGSLFNSPKSNRVALYKSRIYLADYYDSGGNELKTTVLRSSYPMGIVSIINGDVSAVDGSNNWVFSVTETKYFYTDSGMNSYEIYRGSQRIAILTVSSMTETSFTAASSAVAFAPGYSSFLSADEVWIAGTFTGKKKYRWISNSASIGRDVKQYDTFKLTGGDEDAITLLEPIGNILMIANKNNLMTWNDYSLESFDIGIGCCSKNGYVKNGGALYILHYTGFYVSSGGVPQLLSRKVERYIGGATKAGLEAGAVGVKGLSVFCTIGDVTLYKNDGSTWKTLSKVCLEYAIADQNWYVHTNVSATHFKKYLTSAGDEKLTMNSYLAGKDDVFGIEMISNGGFSGDADNWTLGTGWEYEDNNVVLTNA